MQAAVFRRVGEPLTIEDIVIDKPKPRELLIRTAASGVCHSDLHIMDGKVPSYMPIVLGHEAAGIVEAVGEDVRGVKVGDHVITCVSGFCGQCEDCLTGHMSLCAVADTERPRKAPPRLECSDGPPRVHQFFGLSAFAEQMLVHERTCVAIRRDMPLDRAAVIGCAVTTGVGAVIHTARVPPGSTVAVIGCGGVGLSTINGAALAGAGRIIAVDRIASKLDLARVMGATDVVDAASCDPVEAVLELTKGGVHFAFEAIGLKATTEQAFRMLRRGGTATLIGVPPTGTKIELDSMELIFERKIQGSNMGSNHFPIDMPRFVDFYLQGRLKLDQLISRRIALADINSAVDELRTGNIARSVIEFPM
jgi:S-(hydroxymethyl)glutathione dehydrogenase/alcohol dehydrogenase